MVKSKTSSLVLTIFYWIKISGEIDLITRSSSVIPLENQRKNFEPSGSTPLLDLLNLSIIRVFGGVSAIISHQIKNIREYTEEELRNSDRNWTLFREPEVEITRTGS